MKTKTRTKNFKEIMMSNSDSEEDAVMDTVLVWKNNDTVIHAGNKHGNSTVTSKQPHNLPKNMTTLRDIPYNFSRQNNFVNNTYMHRPREMSPMSSRSDARSLNFRGFSQKSIADGTESMISEAPTNVSCAFDIASAIKGGQYTASEAKMITDAVMHKFGKRSIKSGRVKKRKVNKKDISKIVKALLSVLDNDNSDDQSSTSISSEECVSVRSEYPTYNGGRRNMNYAASLQNYPRNFEFSTTRSTFSNDAANHVGMYGSNRTENKRKSFRNMYALDSQNSNKQTLNQSFVSMPPPSTNRVPTKEKKKKILSIPINTPVVNKSKNQKKMPIEEKTSKPKSPVKNISTPMSPSNKSKSPVKGSTKASNINENNSESSVQHTFGNKNLEPRPPEKVISYSKPHCNADLLVDNNFIQKESNKDDDLIFTKPRTPKRLSNKSCNDSNLSKDQADGTENNSDLTKSSFMRRKLFTQTLEITENRETRETDHSRSNSPLVNIYANNKSKKSSYSSRNSLEDTNVTGQQLMDLVKKIVPAEDMKIITEKNDSNKSNNSKEKRPRTNSVDQLSDTFTDDEDIFLLRNKANDTCILNSPQKSVKTSQPVNQVKASNIKTSNSLFISSSSLKLKNTIQKAGNVQNIVTKPKIAVNKSRLGNKRNITTRKANLFWETDTENETDVTQNESTDFGNDEADDTNEQINTSDESKENKLLTFEKENKSDKITNSFENELDEIFRRNPQAYKKHMMKIIKESNTQSPPRIKTLMVNIDKCLDFNNTIKRSKDKNIINNNNNDTHKSRSKANTNSTKHKINNNFIDCSPTTRSKSKLESPIFSLRKSPRIKSRNELKTISPLALSNTKNGVKRKRK